MVESTRLEAFSDGVLAIAITLLVLDLRVPDVPAGSTLGRELGAEWTSYLAYVVSFLVIGIIWLNHHALFTLVARVDRQTLVANLLLLLVVSAIPFPTRLIAEYVRDPGPGRTAALVYSGTMLLMSFAFSALFLTVTRRGGVLLHEPISSRQRLRRWAQFGAGGVVYALTLVVALVSPLACLAVHGVLALYYSFDQVGSRLTARAS